MKKLIATLLALMMVAAACGGDGNGTAGPEPSAAPSTEDAGEDNTSETEPENDAPSPAVDDEPDDDAGQPVADDNAGQPVADDDAGEPVADDEPEEEPAPAPFMNPGECAEGELTDSAPGVTAATIKVGIQQTDFARLAELGIFDSLRGDLLEVSNALFAELNENGGICGRMVEAVTAYNLPFGSETALASCISLTEDEQVFAVIGDYSGSAGTDAGNRCVAEAHNTALIGANFSSQDQDAVSVPWINAGLSRERSYEVLVAALEANGWLDDLGNVAVHTDIDTARLVDEYLVPALEAAGVEIAQRTIVDAPPGDVQAGITQWQTFLELYRGSDISAVFMEGDIVLGVEQLIQSGLGVDAFTTNAGQLRAGLRDSSDPAAITATSLGGPMYGPEGDERFQECTRIFTERTGIELVPTDQLPEGETDWFIVMGAVCTRIDMFVQVAAAAGPDLNNETLQAAIDNLGPIVLPNQPFGSFGPGKYDAQDGVALIQYDPAIGEDGDFVNISDLVNTAG